MPTHASNASTRLPFHHEVQAILGVTPETAFAYLDEHENLMKHMSRPSASMAGGSMRILMDSARGRTIGAVLRIEGRVLGLALEAEEIVIVREPPLRKFWETTGDPRLIVIGHYRMGFILERLGESMARLVMLIDYARAGRGIGRWVPQAITDRYAKWCVERMAFDCAARFPAAIPGTNQTA